MKKRPKIIFTAAGVLAAAAFYLFSGEGKTSGEMTDIDISEGSSLISQEEETFSAKQKEEIRTIVTEALESEISQTIREVLSEKIEEMAENGTLSEGIRNCAEKTAGLININDAGKEELKKIPGIGDVKAENILRYREENGAFRSAEDLLYVDGISAALLEKIRSYITV